MGSHVFITAPRIHQGSCGSKTNLRGRVLRNLVAKNNRRSDVRSMSMATNAWLFSLPAIDELAEFKLRTNAHVELFSNVLQHLFEIEFRMRRRLLSQAPRRAYQERNFQGQRPRPEIP